ncbi:MAG: two-component regulator propeller domain-containing protein [Planctomycetota bacterium]
MSALLVLFLLPCAVFGQEDVRRTEFTPVTKPLFGGVREVSDGMAKWAGLYVLHFDPLGRLMVGTDSGLYRFDGNEFELLGGAQSPPGDVDPTSASPESVAVPEVIQNVLRLTGDGRTVWIVTAQGDVFRLLLNSDRIEKVATPDDAPAMDVRIGADGEVWAVGAFGFARLEGDVFTTVIPSERFEGRLLRRMGIAADGSHYISAVVVVEESTDDKQTAIYRVEDLATPVELGIVNAQVTEILADDDGSMWVAQTNGLHRYFGDEVVEIELGHDAGPSANWIVHDIMFGSEGTLWVATRSGLIELDLREDTSRLHRQFAGDPYTLPSNDVRSISLDGKGRVWTGHFLGEIATIQTGGRFAEFYGPRLDGTGLLSPTVRDAVLASDGTLWVAFDQGLSRRRPGATRFEHMFVGDEGEDIPEGQLGHGPLYCIDEGPDGFIWFGQLYSGFGYIDPSAEELSVTYQRPIDNPDRRLNFGIEFYAGSDGTRWFGTILGLIGHKPDGTVVTHFHAPAVPGTIVGPTVHAIIETSDGTIWVGTEDGAGRLPAGQTQWENFVHDPTDANSLPDNQVYAFHEDAEGRLWISTWRGLARWRPETSDFETIGLDDGLPNDSIGGALVSGDMLWFGTEAGLIRYDLDGGSMRAFGTEQGVPDMYAKIRQKLDDGRLLFGGFGGVVVIDPDKLPAATDSGRRVVFTSAMQSGQQVELPGNGNEAVPGELHLPFGGRFFNITFAGIELFGADDLSYRYQLEGYEDIWHEADNVTRRASYTNVPPGDYTLLVQARAPGLQEDRPWGMPAKLRIVVPPQFYETWWFVALMMALAALVVGVIFEFRRRRTAAQFAAVLGERQRIATELHDTLLQNLYGMQLKAQVARRRMDTDMDKARTMFDEVLDQTSAAISEARQRISASPIIRKRDSHKAERKAALLSTDRSGVSRRSLVPRASSSKQAVIDQRRRLDEAVRETAISVAHLYGVKSAEQLSDPNTAASATVLELDIESGLPRISEVVDEKVTRIVAEAVANASRHARANKIRVSAKPDHHANRLSVIVEDDGIGFDQETVRQRQRNNTNVNGTSAGLRLMRSRSEDVNLDIEINSEPDRGTQIVLRLPEPLGKS